MVWPLGDQRHAAPSLFASQTGVGAYGAFTVMLTLIPFVIIRGAHLPTPVAGLAFIPLQVLITVVSPLTGMLCRRFGGACHCSPAALSSPWDTP